MRAMDRGSTLALAAIGLSLFFAVLGAGLNDSEPQAALLLFEAGVAATSAAGLLLAAMVLWDRLRAHGLSAAIQGGSGALDFSGVVLQGDFQRRAAARSSSGTQDDEGS